MTEDFKIDLEWEDPQGARGKELRATWARLKMIIGGEVVTQVLDARSRTVRDAVYLPLYPLAEWFAFHWWPLLHESGSGALSSDGSFKQRHNLKFAAEGFALPDLTLVADGVSVHAEWRSYAPPSSKVRFIGEGGAIVDQTVFQSEITRLVDTVVQRLKAENIEENPLIDEWTAIHSLDEEEEAFCRAAGALGLDPFALDEETRQHISKIGASLPASTVNEFFQAATAAHLSRQADWLTKTIKGLESTPHIEAPEWPKFPTSQEGEPWQQGYALARKTRQALDLTNWSAPIDEGCFSPAVMEALTPVSADPGLKADAVSIFDGHGSTRIAVMGHSLTSKRFVMARSIGDYVLAGPDVPLLQTRAGSAKQRRNRAFAAEFLAPWEGIRSHFQGREADEDEVEQLADHFLVSPRVIEHQLHNHGVRTLSHW